jgi:SWI/SNF-related matrix-associated actin-dependent regulator of chromatin subfamily A3
MLYRRHHGKNKLSDEEELETVNLVLTTYHTVAAEWKANQNARKSPLFSVRWKRIILDEGRSHFEDQDPTFLTLTAHFIRNGNSRMARAVCALEARSRWAVTGTPIQNRLGDLASLLKFIRVHPYTDPKRFESDISRLWKSGEDEEAVKRLKRLSACILLRRGKGAINLPLRQDLVYKTQFSPEERAVYERIRQQTIAKIDEALGNDSNSTRSGVYVNVLQQIESMRLFSNLGLFYESRHEKPPRSSDIDEWSKVAQSTFNSERDISVITCLQCSSTLGLTETLLDDTYLVAGAAQYTSCLKFVCSDCIDKLSQTGQSVSCGHVPPCQSAPVSTSGIQLEEVDSLHTPQLRISPIALPSKIKTLIEDIKNVPKDVKWYYEEFPRARTL